MNQTLAHVATNENGVNLSGKTAIVTGAGTAIGRELALAFARAGANVVCAGRRLAPLEETALLIQREGGCAVSIRCDVSVWVDVQALAETTLNRFGQIDLLFNNAGTFGCVGPIWEGDPDEWLKDIKVNLWGTMMCCRAVLPHMIERNEGIIITMDGGGGTPGPIPGGSAYGASKIALNRFAEGLARELQRIGSSVLVFCMNPGTVRSGMTEALIATPEREQWMGHVNEIFGSDEEAPADACAVATMKLLAIASPELAGRTFRHHVDFDLIAQNKRRIQEEDLYVMRWITL
jgi:3-oxoacyl-[acyl-carrier protein] reductase